MPKYVDGFVFSVPKSKVPAYKKMAREASVVWKKFGGLDYKECVIDDPKPNFVKFTFPKMAKTKPNEDVWLAFIVFKSRKHRDRVNGSVMRYFEKKYDKNAMPMPFDMKRFAYGGFTVVVEM